MRYVDCEISKFKNNNNEVTLITFKIKKLTSYFPANENERCSFCSKIQLKIFYNQVTIFII